MEEKKMNESKSCSSCGATVYLTEVKSLLDSEHNKKMKIFKCNSCGHMETLDLNQENNSKGNRKLLQD